MVSRLRLAATPSPAAGRALPGREVALRARRLRLLLTDCDGVLTDGSVWVSPRGEALKRFSLRDGMGMERLRGAGVETAIVTRERSPIVARRAEKLRVRLLQGVQDKRGELPRILRRLRLTRGQLALIGDDVNDLGALEEIAREGLTAAPADAEPGVLAAVHYRCQAAGGCGAFREFAEWLLAQRGAGDVTAAWKSVPGGTRAERGEEP